MTNSKKTKKVGKVNNKVTDKPIVEEELHLNERILE